MAKNKELTLVIVESPTKAKTIGQFLGKEYFVESSYGHVRDLPKSRLGIDTEHNFEPQYVVPRKVQPRVTALKKLAAKSGRVILATDEDREGEAIAWHLTQALGLASVEHRAKSEELKSETSKLSTHGSKPVDRIVFHEITKSAIQNALTHPRNLDLNLVNAQQGRRVLDRLVGYKLSPFLWKKIARGLSAGRVQSAALRLIVEREEEIKNFKTEKYFTLEGDFSASGGNDDKVFAANLVKIDGEPLPKPGIASEKEIQTIKAGLSRSVFAVASMEKKEAKKHPLPPFITSTLQQSASQHFGFSSKKTMFLAQGLYENGYITYMRTDSVNLSEEALGGAKNWIEGNLGKEYAVSAPRRFKTKSRLAQEAHEAIRPTDPGNSAPKLNKDEARLYGLIWRRFIASQLPDAVFDAAKIEIESGDKKYVFSANGNVMKFDGFLKVWRAKFEEKGLPEVKEGESAELLEARAQEHQTEPPPRYNEASLIKILEKNGIGRPSTYAPIISVIQTRNYVEKQQGRFYPTEIGTLVNKVLTEYFPEIVDLEFTAKMENELDDIAEGRVAWQEVIKEFYLPFSEHLTKMYEEVQKKEIVDETTDEVCDRCGRPMIIKFGRFGKFLACSGYPECKNTKPLKKEPPKSSGVICPECLVAPERKDNPGELVERRVSRGRARGKIFWGCSKYPDCKFAVWTDPTKEKPVFDPAKAAEKSKGQTEILKK